MTSKVPNEYDLAYRDLFTHPELVEDLLRYFVKEPWVADLDFKSLKRESEISVIRRKSSRIRDVVWSVHFGDRTLYILILIEFQSTVAPIMALRQMIYVATIYEDLYKQKRFTVSGKLPPVLPIVLYNGDGRWNAPFSVEDMIEKAPDALAKYQPRMSYFFLDEKRTQVQLTEDQRNTVAGLLALEQSEGGKELLDVVCLLLSSLREPEHESLRQAFRELILKTKDPELAPIAEIFDHPEDAMTVRERLKDWYQKEKATHLAEGRAEGRAEGVEEGVKKGVRKGRAEGQKTVVEKQLRLKFGPLDEAAQARLAAATSRQLDQWAERVLTASSLDEIWR